jgi:hypothetical protein
VNNTDNNISVSRRKIDDWKGFGQCIGYAGITDMENWQMKQMSHYLKNSNWHKQQQE